MLVGLSAASAAWFAVAREGVFFVQPARRTDIRSGTCHAVYRGHTRGLRNVGREIHVPFSYRRREKRESRLSPV